MSREENLKQYPAFLRDVAMRDTAAEDPVLGHMGPIAWVLDESGLDKLEEAILSSSNVVFDLETTGLDEHAVSGGTSNGGVAARISMASFTLPQKDAHGEWDGVEPTSWVLPLSHPDSPFLGTWRKTYRRLAKFILDHRLPTTGHNVKFDVRWTTACTGIDLSPTIAWDTRISSHLLDENSSTKLKERAPATFGVDRWDDHDLTYPGASEDVPLYELGEYAARDTYWTWRLMEAHQEEMFLTGENAEIGPVDSEEVRDARLGQLAIWVAMPTVAGLTKVEQRGIKLDVEWCKEQLEIEEKAAVKGLDILSERYDMDRSKASAAATSKWFIEMTEKASESNELAVLSLTKTGKAQWSAAVLKKLARNGSTTAQVILDQRGASKRAEYLRSWLGIASPEGTVHASYNAGVVVTGRLSSSNPNMQQVTKALKPAFIPREGYVLSEIDYSQIELRVAAHVSQCQPMIDAFNRGDDLHTLLAARIAHKKPEDVTKEERQKGKSANFGLLYGMGAPGFQTYAETAYGVDMTIQEAVEVHSAFFEQWEGMKEWHLKCASKARSRGEVVSPIGRVRRLPEINSGIEYLIARAERNSINSPVQGFASDMMQMAAASVMGSLPGIEAIDGAYVVATVHDSIVVELKEDRWEDLLDQCLERMTEGLKKPLKRMGCEMTVPLKAEAGVGTRWGLTDIKDED